MRELGVIALLRRSSSRGRRALRRGDGARRRACRAFGKVLTWSMELLFPLATGMVAATVVAADPGIEWQLTMPTPYRVTVFRRLGDLLLWSALVALRGCARCCGSSGDGLCRSVHREPTDVALAHALLRGARRAARARSSATARRARGSSAASGLWRFSFMATCSSSLGATLVPRSRRPRPRGRISGS